MRIALQEHFIHFVSLLLTATGYFSGGQFMKKLGKKRKMKKELEARQKNMEIKSAVQL